MLQQEPTDFDMQPFLYNLSIDFARMPSLSSAAEKFGN